MQPVGPYRFTEVMGVCQVGKVWWAVDGQDRLVTVAVLDPAVAQDPAWRQAFSGMADTLAAPGGSGQPYLAADFAAPAPWAAYIAGAGPGAEHLFFALGQEIRSEQANEDGTVAMLQVPADQSQPAPWALQGDPRQAQQLSTPAQPVAPQQMSAPPQQVLPVPQQVSAPPPQVLPVPQQVSAPPQQAFPVPQQVSAPPQQVLPVPQQVSAPPQQVSPVPQQAPSPPQPVPSALHPVSAAPGSVAPASGVPVSGAPASGGPVSGAPASGVPASGVPAPGVPAWPAADATVQLPTVQVGPPAGVPQYDPFAAPGRRIQPSEPPKRQRGLWAAVAALLLVAVVGGGAGLWVSTVGEPEAAPTVTATATPPAPGLKPWAEAAPRSQEERALATAAPSMVFLETIITGYVRNKQDNRLLHPEPFTFSRRCTGVVVNHDGQVLTNGQCVRPSPDIMRDHALDALARALVADGKLKAGDVSGYTRARKSSTVFTGPEAGAGPESKLYGQLNVARGDVTGSPAIPGTVVRALTLDEGNLALVKLDQASLPAVELNTSATVAPDTSLLALGYGTTDTDYRSATYTVLSKPVKVTEVDLQSSAYRISEDVGTYSRGGIALDLQGRVVGMLDNDLLRSDNANRLVAPVSKMTELLGAAGVENSLGEPDRAYRSALDAYFTGDKASAASRFDDVVKGSPTNALAQAYREAAIVEGGGESSSRTGLVVLLFVVAAVALAGGLGTLAWSRRRRDP
ncbi:trypsin-like peptidase domain-containing protein [Micromonospora sp. NPDC007230]|uniref:S1 family peptidase n=1 Tax=Micromonospora sp. NPDC007230 TaxID=3364237 RepID=UPI003696FC7E